jgi:hypothetical protein
VFENRAQGRIFGTTREEATGDWKKLQMWILINYILQNQKDHVEGM